MAAENITQFYADLQGEVCLVERQHKKRLQCRSGCCDCCVDNITVFEIEACEIVDNCADVLSQAPHPKGKCAFLDRLGRCRIYAFRPYVCRTQGLPLRWTEDLGERTVEYRDICPLNETDEPLEILPAENCWSLGPFEGRLALMQQAKDGGRMKRVSLRSLFHAKGIG